MKMEINGIQTELSVEEFVKLSELLEDKTEDTKEVTGFEIARNLINELTEEEGDDKEPEEFSVGDVVMVNDDVDDVGVIVKDDKSDSIPYKVEYFRGGTEWCDPSELHRLEGEELAEYNRDHIKEGDIVVIIGNTNLSANNVGDIGKIGAETKSGFTRKVFVPNGQTLGIWTYLEEFRLATEDERKKYEEAVAKTTEEDAEELPFKVGDKVRVIVPYTETPHYDWGDVKRGDVGVVSNVLTETLHVDFENQNMWTAQPSELELFDEDADLPAGTTIKAKDSGKSYVVKSRNTGNDEYGYGKAYKTTSGGWLGIDQVEVINVPLAEPTPDDSEHTFEVGDIVQVTEYMCGHTVGTIGVVESFDSFGDPTVSAVLDDREFVVYEEENVKLIAKHYDRKDV